MKHSNRSSHVIACLSILAGCAKATPPPEAPVAAAPPAEIKAEPAPASSDQEAAAKIAANLRRVHFQFDSDSMTDDSQAALAENAQILKAHPAISIEVQGHCDTRGTTEYNLSLGQRRADAVRKYLQHAAVADAQVVQTVSFGKEKPIASGEDEKAWSQNRRAEFRVITAGTVAEVLGTTD